MEYSRTLYPRPQFERSEWINLNGKWTCHIQRKAPFEKYRHDSRENIDSKGFEMEINVPFAPETKASGLEVNELIKTIYYHRILNIPKAYEGKKILLHFEAVFYHAEIYIDGSFVDFHDGGSSSFSVDITKFVQAGGDFNLVVKAESDLASGNIPSGKQSSFIQSYACFYHRTTGIWQSVWMEAVSNYALASVKCIWNSNNSELIFNPEYYHIKEGNTLTIEIEDGSGNVGSTFKCIQGEPISLKIDNPHLWSNLDPHLYSIKYNVKDKEGDIIDSVSSYMGLRTINIEDGFVYLNGKKIYQRLVLDQGFYPDGNWTAPTEKDLERDIILSKAAGFNGARLHQKVFEQRFFYYADKYGYFVWAESPSWGLDYNNEGLPARNFITEWSEIIKRDINHPSIIAWTPLNETYLFVNQQAHRRLHRDVYNICKLIDPTRPVNDASGYIHFITDLWTVHTYEQEPNSLSEKLKATGKDIFRCFPNEEVEYDGQPYLVDEFGGIKWDVETQDNTNLSESQNLESWGYGRAPRTINEFYSRLEGLVEAILDKEHICGYCYTQLTDVEQEKNGIYLYNRQTKFDMQIIRSIFSNNPEGYEEYT